MLSHSQFCTQAYIAESCQYSLACTCYVQLSTPVPTHRVQSANIAICQQQKKLHNNAGQLLAVQQGIYNCWQVYLVTPTNVANVANVAIQGGQTSHHHKRRNLGWTNVTPPTNVTTFKTSQTLRTTNVTRCRNIFCAHFQLLKCSTITSTLVSRPSLK